MNHRNTTLRYKLAVLIISSTVVSATSILAATITYVGNQDDVESASNTPTGGCQWRLVPRWRHHL